MALLRNSSVPVSSELACLHPTTHEAGKVGSTKSTWLFLHFVPSDSNVLRLVLVTWETIRQLSSFAELQAQMLQVVSDRNLP